MTFLIKTFLPLFLKGAGFFIKKSQLKAEEKQQWLNVTKMIAGNLNLSLSLHNSDELQDKDLDQQWEEKYKKDPELAIKERQNPGVQFERRSKDGALVSKRKKS